MSLNSHTPSLGLGACASVAGQEEDEDVCNPESTMDRLTRENRELRSALRALVGAASAVPDRLLIGAEQDPPTDLIQPHVGGQSLRH